MEDDSSEDDNSEDEKSEDDSSETDNSEDGNYENEDSQVETDVEADLLKSKFSFVILTMRRLVDWQCFYFSACLLMRRKWIIFCGGGLERSLPPLKQYTNISLHSVSKVSPLCDK